MNSLEEIRTYASQGAKPEQVTEMLDAYITAHPDDEPALVMRGMTHWSMNHRRLAIQDYLAAVRINPESKAKEALRAAYSILNFYNKDLYNP